jgi:two-component system chemotaxis response regulator CheB
MPRMDGLTFLQKIMSQHPIPVVICSTLTEKGSATALKALEYGAVEIITNQIRQNNFEESRIRICDSVRVATSVNLKRLMLLMQPKLTADVIIQKASSKQWCRQLKVIVVGASTGGTRQ